MAGQVDYRTDKVSLGYLPAYQRLAAIVCGPGRGHFPTVLEIGAADGAGMEMLRSVFSVPVQGVEFEADRALQAAHFGPVTQADQSDPDLPKMLPGPWDLIVDDASHEAHATAVTLANMWPTLRVGGFYVIEDWNYFDAIGMASNLWQMIYGGYLSKSQEKGHRYSGQLGQVGSVTVQNGMIILAKGSTVEYPW